MYLSTAVTDEPSSASTWSDSVDGDVASIADHVTVARQRAREVLGGETQLGDADDWRQSIVSARDGVVLVLILWVTLRGFFKPSIEGPILVTAGLAFSLYIGIARAVATRVRLRYHEQELERERREIDENPDHEQEEVRALYAAKGFREPLLTQVTDTLCADDDRLLKLMLEEELGLFIHHMHHPLLVGLWNTCGAAIGSLTLAVPVCVQRPGTAAIWLPAGATALIIVMAAANAWVTRRRMIPLAATWLAMATVTVTTSHFLAELLAGKG